MDAIRASATIASTVMHASASASQSNSCGSEFRSWAGLRFLSMVCSIEKDFLSAVTRKIDRGSGDNSFSRMARSQEYGLFGLGDAAGGRCRQPRTISCVARPARAYQAADGIVIAQAGRSAADSRGTLWHDTATCTSTRGTCLAVPESKVLRAWNQNRSTEL